MAFPDAEKSIVTKEKLCDYLLNLRIRLVERRPLGLLLSAILVNTGTNFAMIFLLSPLPVRTSLPNLLRTA